MLTTTGYFGHACVFRILAILTAILAVRFCVAITNAVRALVLLCHTTCFLDLVRLDYIR
jgi:hypothetical protein